MADHDVVSQDQWIEARKSLLAAEKAHTRAYDALVAARQALPWTKVEKDYRFTGPQGELGLADLFRGKSQLLVQHFMFGPDWDEGCKSCSMMADHINPAIPHLKARDVSLVLVSRAPIEKLEAYRERMGWDFLWVSSLGSDFNIDFDVSFPEGTPAHEHAVYNFREIGKASNEELPGMSAFRKDGSGAIFRTYSVYGRGVEAAMGIYPLLDMVSKGRDEEGLDYAQSWFRRHDEYGED